MGVTILWMCLVIIITTTTTTIINIISTTTATITTTVIILLGTREIHNSNSLCMYYPILSLEGTYYYPHDTGEKNQNSWSAEVSHRTLNVMHH